jgi:hypothetical protein
VEFYCSSTVFFSLFFTFLNFFSYFSTFYTFIKCIFIFVSQNLKKKYTPLLAQSCKVQFYPLIEKRFYTSREGERSFTARSLCFFSLFCSFYTFFYFYKMYFYFRLSKFKKKVHTPPCAKLQSSILPAHREAILHQSRRGAEFYCSITVFFLYVSHFLHFFHFFAFFIILFYNFTLYIICIHTHAGAHAHGNIK